MTVPFRIKLLASHVAVALTVSAVTLIVVERSVSDRMSAQLDARLEAQGRALTQWLEGAGHPNRLARRLAGVVGARVTVFDERSEAIGESSDEALRVEAVYDDDRAVVAQTARSGEVHHYTRFSTLAQGPVRFVAVPAPNQAVIRLGFPIGEIEETKSEVRQQLALTGGISVLLAVALAALVAIPLTRRLNTAIAYARRVGAGEYDAALPEEATDEVGVLTATLRDAATELQRTDERRRQFLANVAHELRTPVTSIRGYAETLLNPSVKPERSTEFLAIIHRNSLRIGKLVDDLLELEAIEAAGHAGCIERFHLAPLAESIAKTLGSLAKDNGATIEVVMPDEVTACADPEAVERILLNLADNAVRHGGGRVRMAAESRGRSTLVIVSDEGGGIPEAERAVVFERFQRGSHARRTGTGLGLAIARELAHSVDGTLRLAATAHGTQFELELPA